MDTPTCPTHGTPLVSYCPACRGKAGGLRKSIRKAKSSARNGKKGGRPKGAQLSASAQRARDAGETSLDD